MSFEIATEYLFDLAPLADLRLEVDAVVPFKSVIADDRDVREKAIGIINNRVSEVKTRACNEVVEALGGVGVRPLEPCYVEPLASALFVYSHNPYAPTFTQKDAVKFQTAKLEKSNLPELERVLRLAETICSQGISAEAGKPEFAWIVSQLLELAGRPEIEISRPWDNPDGGTYNFLLVPNTREVHQYDIHEIWSLSPLSSQGRYSREPSIISSRYRNATAEQTKKMEEAFALLRLGEPIAPTTLVQAITYLRLNEVAPDKPQKAVINMGRISKAFMQGELSAYARKAGVELTFVYDR